MNIGASASVSLLKASFGSREGVTGVERIREAGVLRLRRPHATAFEGIIVNTGGGIVGGDRLAVALALGPQAQVTLTSVAAEKVYRSAGPCSEVSLDIRLEAGAALDWLPQETILFSGSRLRRRLDADVATAARLLIVETTVFGRLASAETSIEGFFRDSWRIRRAGRLVFAEETRLEGAIGEALDRAALGGGARAAALLLLVEPGAEAWLDRARDALAGAAADDPAGTDTFGASATDGILVARLLAHSPARLRASIVALLGVLGRAPPPRIWV